MRIRWPSRYGSFIALRRYPSCGWHLSLMINGRYWAWWKGGSNRFDNIWRKGGEAMRISARGHRSQILSVR